MSVIHYKNIKNLPVQIKNRNIKDIKLFNKEKISNSRALIYINF